MSTAGPHYLVNYGFILIFDPYIHLGHEQNQWPIFNVKYSVSGILFNVPAFISGQHQPFLYSNYLTLIIGACHIHLCSHRYQMLGWGRGRGCCIVIKQQTTLMREPQIASQFKIPLVVITDSIWENAGPTGPAGVALSVTVENREYSFLFPWMKTGTSQ